MATAAKSRSMPLSKKTAFSRRTATIVRYWSGTAVPVLALGLLAGCNEAQNKFVAPPPPSVGVSVPLQKAVTPYLELTGSMAAYASVTLVARVEGYLKAINYVDGSTVKAGTLLFEIEPAPYQAQYKAAQGSVLGARADLIQAEAEFQRQFTLFQQAVTDQATLDRARAKRDADQATLETQEANLQNAGINLSYTRIEAPFDGTVTRHLASIGELVGKGGNTTLASLVQLEPIYVMFNVSDQDLMKFRANEAGHRLTLTELQHIPVEIGLMNEDGFPHAGKVDYVSPSIDPQTATILVRGVFENKNRVLLPGMFARVRVPLGPPVADALLVPDRVLQQNQQGRYVLVVGANDEVEQRIVQLGQLDGSLRVVAAGLKPDDRVVVTALDRAIPGRKVAPRPFSLAVAADGSATTRK
jgi:RND family efflux transporter MFP subunit